MEDTDAIIILHPQDHSEYRFVDLDEALTLWPDGDEEKNAVMKGFELLINTHYLRDRGKTSQ